MVNMNRKRMRYERHVATRERRRRERFAEYDDYDKIFSYENMYRAGNKIVLGVRWKASIQRYIANKPTTVYRIYNELRRGVYQPDPFYEFEICERGKKRHIRSCTVRDRNVQRCLCDFSLVPAVSRSFIYDNGASMKNKGYSFSVRRIKKHLREYHHRHGNHGYILLFDFKKFFDNVDHETLREIIFRTYQDKRMRRIVMTIVESFSERGLGLGSQVSQVLALASANELDHFVKEKLRIRWYGRYMDDGYLIHESKEYLQYCLSEIAQVCEKIGITVNRKKTRIMRIDKGFTYLKIRFFVTDSGRIVRKIPRQSITRMRRKLKKLKKKFDAGRIKIKDVETSLHSWVAYADNFDSWHTKNSMKALYEELFSGRTAA